jgi:hypothetical protein
MPGLVSGIQEHLGEMHDPRCKSRFNDHAPPHHAQERGASESAPALLYSGAEMTLPIVHHPAYVARLPEGHRFPMDKFGRLADVLIEEGLATRARFLVPAPAPETWLALAHSAVYVAQVLTQRVPSAVQREIGFPVEESVALRARCATAGTVLAARLALEHGIAANTAGGSHHARAEQGAGFCVFNDVAVAARVLQAEGSIGRVLVLDCDVHQGWPSRPFAPISSSTTPASIRTATTGWDGCP